MPDPAVQVCIDGPVMCWLVRNAGAAAWIGAVFTPLTFTIAALAFLYPLYRRRMDERRADDDRLRRLMPTLLMAQRAVQLYRQNQIDLKVSHPDELVEYARKMDEIDHHAFNDPSLRSMMSVVKNQANLMKPHLLTEGQSKGKWSQALISQPHSDLFCKMMFQDVMQLQREVEKRVLKKTPADKARIKRMDGIFPGVRSADLRKVRKQMRRLRLEPPWERQSGEFKSVGEPATKPDDPLP